MTATIVGTSLIGSGPVSHRGFVDVVDCQLGVRGWALDLAAPDDPVRLQLLVGDIVVAEISPDLPRHDISEALGVDVAPGFTFDPSALEMVAELAESADDLITIRFAGTRLALGMSDDPPRAEEIIATFRQSVAAAVPAKAAAANLDSVLADLGQRAGALSQEALRPSPENLQGYIETLAIDSSGQVWMIGWMRRGHPSEFAAVISERKKIPAAVAVMTFLRPDLPADSYGIIGLVSSTWRPTSSTGDFFVFFGAGGHHHLRGHTPLRFITASDLVTEYEGIRARCQVEGHAVALHRMLTAMESWQPNRSPSQSFGTETSLDRILLVPGLGCLVEGWVVSPLKRVEGLRLRIGGVVMTAQADATYWKPRPDLRTAFAASDKLLKRAGFVAMCSAFTDPEDYDDPVLKVVFEGGASANWPIPTKILRRLGHSATVEDALLFFPALQEESFFPRFADATIRAQRDAMDPLVPMKTARTSRALVMVLPEDRCDTFLLFEELSLHCRGGQALDGGVLDGVALIASSTSNRSDALWMFQEFQLHCDLPASLLVIDDTAQAFAQLPEILRTIGATQFAFIGPGVFLTASGWQDLRNILQSGTQDLHFLALEPDEFEMPSDERGISARCFAWNTQHFVRWSAKAACFLGGFHRENGLLGANVPHVVHKDAARNSRWLLPSRIQEAVNISVYGTGARF